MVIWAGAKQGKDDSIPNAPQPKNEYKMEIINNTIGEK